jgi:hypothetical protein
MKTRIFSKEFELAQMPDEQLPKMARRLEAEIHRLEGRIDAITDQFPQGNYVQENGEAPRWFKAMCGALDRHRTALMAVEGEVSRRAQEAAVPTLADIFLSVCAEKMQPELYSKVLVIAQKRLDKLQEVQI